jgi:WD40 repeat protein
MENTIYIIALSVLKRVIMKFRVMFIFISLCILNDSLFGADFFKFPVGKSGLSSRATTVHRSPIFIDSVELSLLSAPPSTVSQQSSSSSSSSSSISSLSASSLGSLGSPPSSDLSSSSPCELLSPELLSPPFVKIHIMSALERQKKLERTQKLEGLAASLEASRGSQGCINKIDPVVAMCLTPKLWLMITEYLFPRSSIPDASSITSVDFSPVQNYIAVTRDEGSIQLWNTSNNDCKMQKTWTPGHYGCADIVAFSPDGSLFVTTGKDRTLRVIDMGTQECRGMCITTYDPERIHTSLQTVHTPVTVGEKAKEKIAKYRFNSYRLKLSNLISDGTRVRALAFNKDSAQLLTRDGFGTVTAWSMKTLEKLYGMIANKCGGPVVLDTGWHKKYARLNQDSSDTEDNNSDTQDTLLDNKETGFTWRYPLYNQQGKSRLWDKSGRVAYVNPNSPDELCIFHGWLDPKKPGYQML